MGFSALIFDLDGTLVDSARGIERSIRHALDERLPGREIADLSEQIGPPVKVMLRRLCPDIADRELDALVASFRQHYDCDGWRDSVLYPRVKETLRTLDESGVTMFVLTNKPAAATRAILDGNAIASRFRDVCSPDGPGSPFSRKADAAMCLRAEHRLDPATTAVVGDGRDDAEAAAKCGFAFVFARYGYGAGVLAGELGVMGTIETFDELLPLTLNSKVL